MQVLVSHLMNLPIVSLQTGETVAFANEPIIDMAKLEVVALHCSIPHQRPTLALLARDIRQLTAEYLLIDSEDELIDPDEVVRLTTLVKAGFSPLEKPVVSDLGRRLGRTDDYAINLETNRIQKLYIRSHGMRAWIKAELTIDRAQIVDVTPHHIVVRDSALAASILPPEAIPDSST